MGLVVVVLVKLVKILLDHIRLLLAMLVEMVVMD
jgi:hypothetical protein